MTCTTLRLRCRECGWSGHQQSYDLHSRRRRHYLVEVQRPVCQPGEPACESCAANARVRAELHDLHDLHVLDRAAAPDPEDVSAAMRANGLIDPEHDPSVPPKHLQSGG